ncbi:murein biosynthesis integral membrane protein MurJ [Candidatus Curtissbacteria bacterium RIFCSPHIGHO2_01_FULL_41_11]|uniref:Probable lipid II flippase MurJ n=1 Tax=Candidatus Curtissbacteria bacterium RIFCSPHIGHO2_01_FULL_41_11 TaxID=1797711 RepID=A0A1F5G4B0_9BACT|nr:MAG: murein biosynthesis integral membrane protein MurJ [Candidatus Curtissbacteria bacterium RIFCSPHIGHO2_01_FULL_41_11]
MLYFLKNGAGLFKKKQEDILSAAFVIAFSVALSKILGLVRLRLLASSFGDDIHLLDSLIAAQSLPDAIFEVFIFGSIALAFIPVFSQYIAHDKLDKAWELSNKMITLGLVVFLVFLLVIFVFADFIAPLLAPGVIERDPTTQSQIAKLLRIMIFAQAFFVISIFITGILQSFQRFLVPALASIFYNVGIIISIIFLVPALGIYAPAFGMILGALLHLVIQLPLALSLGYRFKPSFDFKNKDVREMFSLMWPRSLSLGLLRISDIINIRLASYALAGSITAFNYAQVLMLVPISLFAGSLAQAALPSLSIEFNAKRYEQFKKIFTQSFHQILFLIFPATAILAILRIPVVRLAFGALEFPWDITVLTGRTLIAFSIGIAAQAISLLILRGFHTIRDSKTPVVINLISVTLNIILAVIFIVVMELSVVYLAIAYAIGNIVNATLMLIFLDRKVSFNKIELMGPVLKMLFIGILTAISLYIPMKFLDQLVFDTTKTIGLILLTGVATVVGLTVYISLSWVLKVPEVVIFYNLGKRIISFSTKLTNPAPTSLEAQEPNP